MAEQNEKKAGKKTVVHFTAAWIPGEKEKEDANCAVTGMIQIVDGFPTKHPAYLTYRDYEEEKPSFWPGVTNPEKGHISYGPSFEEDEFNETNLHEKHIKDGTVFYLKDTDGVELKFQIVKVVDLTA